MATTPTTGVPVVSLALDDARFAAEFGGSFERYGFAMISDHGLDPALVSRAWDVTRQLFALPDDVKRRYHVPGGGGARGYTPFGTEVAKGATAVDLKEFWHVGRDLPAGHRLAAQQPGNVWPAEVAAFRDTMTELFIAFDAVGDRLLAGIARYLGLAPDWFVDPVKDGNSVLRLLHYPPVAAPAPGTPVQGIRAEAHEDINVITLLLGAEEAGLEILDRDGQWLPVNPPAGALAVNVGDMLQRLTNHRLPSTTHRVANPDAGRAAHARYSMPFFLHFRSDFPIRTLPACVDDSHPDRYPEPILADDFLQERLREIGLKK